MAPWYEVYAINHHQDRHRLGGRRICYLNEKLRKDNSNRKKLTLEGSVKSKNKWTLHTGQNILFVHDMALLSILYNTGFLDTFKGIGAISDTLNFNQFD